jgi:hypothetical protein
MIKNSKFKYYSSKRSDLKQILNIEDNNDNIVIENNIISLPISNYLVYRKEKQYMNKLHSNNFIGYYFYVFYKYCIKQYLLNNLYETVKNCLIISLTFTFIANNNRVGRYFEMIFNSVKGLGKQIFNIN